MPSPAALGASSLIFAIGAVALVASVAEPDPRPVRHPLPRRALIATAATLAVATVALAAVAALAALSSAGLTLAVTAAAIHEHRAHDDDDDDGEPPGGGDQDRDPPRRPDGGVDWDEFERAFWAHVERRRPAGRV